MTSAYNVLYLSYDGLTDPLGQSQVLSYLKGLSQSDNHRQEFNITIISFEKPDRFQLFQSEIQEICDQHSIKWYPLHYTKKPPVLSTVYDCWRMEQLAKKLHKQQNFQIVHCRSYISAIVGLHMKQQLGTKFLFDIRGFWVDERIEGGIWNPNKWLYKQVIRDFRKKEIQFFQSADHIISLTHAGKEVIVNHPKWKRKSDAITVIPCCVDLNHFNPDSIPLVDKSALKNRLEINDNQFIVSYIGSLGTWYQLEEMLLFFNNHIRLKHTNSVFLIVTKDNPQLVVEICAKIGLNLEYIKVTESAFSEVPLHISISSVSLFFIRPTFSKLASSPTKQGEIMAMGIPIICNDGVGDTSRIVQEGKAGWIFSENKHFEWNWDEFDATTAKRYTKEYMGVDVGVESYSKVYNQLLNNPV